MLSFPLSVALAGLGATTLVSAHSFPHHYAPHPLAKRASVSSDVTVQLFEYNWNSVAKECTDWLGPQGYGYAQVSPAHEHIKGEAWWTDYQPVSYKIGDNKRGTAAEFKAMIDTCSKAGVGIIVDTILNHMAGGSASGTGTSGSTYSQFTYPAVPYTRAGFHTDSCQVDWYTKKGTYDCWLSNLQDLKTESTAVRQAQAKYLQAMMDLGVASFRLDAAKSIPHEDIRAVLDLMSSKPYIVQEVNSDAGQAATPNMYTPNGLVHEFRACYKLRDAFLSGEGLKSLLSWPNSDWVPSESAVVFVANHDTERMDNMLKWSSPNNGYTLASVFVLAQPYGAPAQLSGYEFTTNHDAGAPTDSKYNVLDTTCYESGWRCEQRWDAIAAMTKFHNAVGSSKMTNSTATGINQISFGRGDIGHVAINFQGPSWTTTLDTDVADGTYCEIISNCASKITVKGGSFTVTIPSYGAIAFYKDSTSTSSPATLASAPAYTSKTSAASKPAGYTSTTKAAVISTAAPSSLVSRTATSSKATASASAKTVSVTFKLSAYTVMGQDIYLTGSSAELGNWSSRVALSRPAGVNKTATWTATVKLPASSTFEYKFTKVVGSGSTILWESGNNRVLKTGASGSQQSVNASWK